MLARGMGAYALADRWTWSSSEVSDEIRRFANEVSATNGDVDTSRNRLISAGTSGSRFWNEWQIFMRDWNAYQAHRAQVGQAAFGTNFTSAIVNLRGLVDRYNPLEERFRSLTGVSATQRSQDTRTGSWLSMLPGSSVLGVGGSLGLIAAVGLGTVALVALAVLATQARAFAQPALSVMKRNKRRRRHRR